MTTMTKDEFMAKHVEYKAKVDPINAEIEALNGELDLILAQNGNKIPAEMREKADSMNARIDELMDEEGRITTAFNRDTRGYNPWQS
jgi:lipopolysaccharide biosynthesis protein